MKTRVLKTLRVKLQRAQLWKRLKVPRRNVSLLNVLEGGQVWLLRVGRQASSWQELAGPPAVSLSLWVTVEFGNSTQSRLAATCTLTWPPSGCAVDYTPRHLQVFWGSWQGSELLLHWSQRDRLLHEQTAKHGFDLKSSSQSNLTKKKVNKRNVHILLTQDPLEVTASVGLASDITQHSSVLNLKVFLL